MYESAKNHWLIRVQICLKVGYLQFQCFIISFPTKKSNVVETIIIHPFGNGHHTTYKNGDEWGMVYDIVLPTLYYRAIPVSSIFGQHDAVSILLTLLIVKLVEAPGQRAGTGAHQAEPNLFPADLEFSWSSTSHFPVQFGDFLPFHDLNVLTSSVFHPQIWNILTCLLSIFMGFARFFIFLGVLAYFFPVMSSSAVFTVRASTQRPWSDARDIIQLVKRKHVLLIRSLRNLRYLGDQNSWVLGRVITETLGRKRSWCGISKDIISALRRYAIRFLRSSMCHVLMCLMPLPTKLLIEHHWNASNVWTDLG